MVSESMMTEINLLRWYGNRGLTHSPSHFINCDTPLTDEAKFWVLTRLTGRFAITQHTDFQTFITGTNYRISFENPAEATMYELRWAGENNFSVT